MGRTRTERRDRRTRPDAGLLPVRSTNFIPYVLTVVVLVLAILAAGSMGDFSARPVVDATVSPVEATSSPTPSAAEVSEPLIDDGDRIVIDSNLTIAIFLLLVISLLALLVRVLLRLRSRPTIRGGSLDSAQVRPAGTLEPVAESLPTWTQAAEEELTGTTDTADAVIRCWLSFEQMCAQAGLPRRSTETTSDFASAVAQALDVPADALTTLNRVYQQARFARARQDGHGALDAAERELALQSVRLLAAAVQDGERR